MNFEYKDVLLDQSQSTRSVNSTKTSKDLEAIDLLFKYWYVPLGLLLIILLGRNLIMMGAFIFMTATTLALAVLKHKIGINMGLELITFYSVILSITANPLTGILFAIIMIFLADLMSGRICAFIIVKIAVYTALCLIASFIEPSKVVFWGIIIVILRNVGLMGATFFLNRGFFYRDIPASLVNIMFNVLIFTGFAKIILSLISL